MAEPTRFLRGLPALIGHLAAAFALAPIWWRTRGRWRRRRLEQLFFARALRAVGITVVGTGRPVSGGGVLFLANHISFTDILAIGVRLDALFVAKADVRRWPVLGRLAERFGVIFVDRDSAAGVNVQVAAIAAQLRRGRNVVLFPEGTTSDGQSVLPFRSSLLAACEGARSVQPVAIRYLDGARRAYVGDESLIANLLRLAPHRGTVELSFLPPLCGAAPRNRKRLAQEAHTAIAAALNQPTRVAAPGPRTARRRSVPTS